MQEVQQVAHCSHDPRELVQEVQQVAHCSHEPREPQEVQQVAHCSHDPREPVQEVQQVAHCSHDPRELVQDATVFPIFDSVTVSVIVSVTVSVTTSRAVVCSRRSPSPAPSLVLSRVALSLSWLYPPRHTSPHTPVPRNVSGASLFVPRPFLQKM